jgi:hypothetical protein
VSEKIIEDLADRLRDKMHEQMNDYLDLCRRSDCGMREASQQMLAVLLQEAMFGMITFGVNKKDALRSTGLAYDIALPEVEEAIKREKARRK